MGDEEESGEEDCIYEGSLIGFYKDQVADNDKLRWFNGYAECFREETPHGALGGVISDFDSAYSSIMGQVEIAIHDFISGVSNPITGASYIKFASKCFVFHVIGELRQGCHSPINMRDCCAMSPVGQVPPLPNRNCQVSGSHNPSNTTISTWLASNDALNSQQQMSLDTNVGATYSITFGLYTPDTPPEPANSRFYFLIREDRYVNAVPNETIREAWTRHRERFEVFPGYIAGWSVIGYSHVLRVETTSQSWVTIVYQSQSEA